jgi:cobalt-zinc-cadmium efflux system membrane fusion protein
MKYIYTLLLVTSLLVSCGKEAKKASKEAPKETAQHKDIVITDAQFKNSNMALGTATQQDFPTIVKTTGMIDVPPQSKQLISSFYGGNIKKSNLLIGDKVRKGQALVTIENPEFVTMQQDFLELHEQLAYLKNEYERQKTLFDEKISSQKKYLQAKSQYNAQKARYNGLRRKLQMLNINTNQATQGNFVSAITLYAKINGYVTKVNVSTGTYVSPNDVILEIVNTDHIHVELTVFEKDVMKIKKGQDILFKIPEASDSTFKAEVHLVGTAINEQTRSVKVHGHLHDEQKNTFAIGMFVEASIATSKNKTLAVPEDAVIADGEHHVILILEKKEGDHYTFEAKEVKIGKTYNGYTEILSAIATDSKILVKGAFNLVGANEGGGHSH